MDLFEAFALGLGIFVLAAPFLITYRNRKRRLNGGSEPPIGTPQDLAKAEAKCDFTFSRSSCARGSRIDNPNRNL